MYLLFLSFKLFLVIPYIEEKNSNEGLCAALPTFPAIRHPNSLRAKVTLYLHLISHF